MSNYAPKKPDWILQAKIKDGYSARVGVAWTGKTAEGVTYLSLKLNPGSTLTWNDDLLLALFLLREPDASEGAAAPEPSSDDGKLPF